MKSQDFNSHIKNTCTVLTFSGEISNQYRYVLQLKSFASFWQKFTVGKVIAYKTFRDEEGLNKRYPTANGCAQQAYPKYVTNISTVNKLGCKSKLKSKI